MIFESTNLGFTFTFFKYNIGIFVSSYPDPFSPLCSENWDMVGAVALANLATDERWAGAAAAATAGDGTTTRRRRSPSAVPALDRWQDGACAATICPSGQQRSRWEWPWRGRPGALMTAASSVPSRID